MGPIDLLWDEPGFVRCAKRPVASAASSCANPGASELRGVVPRLHGGDHRYRRSTVHDAAGCETVVPLGVDVAGPTAIRYAATHPDRVTASILFNSFAHYLQEDNYPVGFSPEELEEFTAMRSGAWGTDESMDLVAPRHTHDQGFRVRFARWQRLVVSPEQNAQSLRHGFSRDVRSLLP
jgi:pimeloyl-ACP methyl ester carboxylesterase